MGGEITEIVIETCVNCQTHSWCTRHDESKYQKYFEETKAEIIKLCPNVKVSHNTVENSYFIPRMGAFEIWGNEYLLFSKIKTGMWPRFDLVAQRVKNFIDDYRNGNDVEKYLNMDDLVQQQQKNTKKSRIQSSIQPKLNQVTSVKEIQKENKQETQKQNKQETEQAQQYETQKEKEQETLQAQQQETQKENEQETQQAQQQETQKENVEQNVDQQDNKDN